jgi:uncharacterized protein
MIIDSHCHTTERAPTGHPSASRFGFRRYLKRAAVAGITQSVVFSTFAANYPSANADVARIVKRHGKRLLGLLCVHAQREAGHVARHVATALSWHDFRGIKVHCHDSPLSEEVCTVAEQLRLPILYDPVGELDRVRWAINRFPSVMFVIPHLGSFDDDWLAQRGVIELMERHANIMTDSSGIRCFDLLQEAVAKVGATRILFGSDGPYLHPGVELAKIRLLGLSPEDDATVLWHNARRVFGDVPSG